MMFKYQEVVLSQTMPAGDVLSALDKIGTLPRGVSGYLKKCLTELRGTVVFGRAEFADGRLMWTITGFGKKERVHTQMIDCSGHVVGTAKQHGRQAVATIELRRANKLVRKVMQC